MNPETKIAVFGCLLLISLAQVDGKERAKTLSDLEAVEESEEKYNIIGGNYDVLAQRNNFLVQLVSNPYLPSWRPYCTGVLITRDTVLTAADCIEPHLPQVGLVGFLPMLFYSHAMVFNFSEHFPNGVHPSSHPGVDLGVYQSTSNVRMGRYVSIASLAFEDIDDRFSIRNASNNPHCFIMGFGNTRERCRDRSCRAYDYQRRDVFILPPRHCHGGLLNLDESTICVLGARLCAADVGGPLMCEVQPGKYAVYGIAGFNAGPMHQDECNSLARNSIYVKIPYHYETLRRRYGYRDPDNEREERARQLYGA